MTDLSPGERLWRVTYSCGHSHEVWTFIGDFDYVKHHEGLTERCAACRDLVAVVAADVIRPD